MDENSDIEAFLNGPVCAACKEPLKPPRKVLCPECHERADAWGYLNFYYARH